MVKLGHLGIAVCAVFCALLAVAPSAVATGGQPPVDPGGGKNGGGGSSSGGPVFGSAGGCSLFANASSFGMSCVTGGSVVAGKSVKTVLDGDKAPNCWDELIADPGKYGMQAAPDGSYHWYMHYCISGLDVNAPVNEQPGLQLDPKLITIQTGAPDCPSPQPVSKEGQCVMTLTSHQRQVVELGALQGGQIPPIVLVSFPSTKVRTNEQVAFENRGGDGMTKTPVYHVGGVSMWAVETAFKIYPDGPNGPAKTCDGATLLQQGDTPQTNPDACWWKYGQSSAQQPDQAYPFRAEADWSVMVSDANGTKVFASFEKYWDQPLPVFDIQTLVVGG